MKKTFYQIALILLLVLLVLYSFYQFYFEGKGVSVFDYNTYLKAVDFYVYLGISLLFEGALIWLVLTLSKGKGQLEMK
ncbi:hypothetical protein [Myroides phaeus]|uniref:Uncharacterized protein n=1 Tax=Myroides phaeus TaxID=702745 RepID=A0A1G8BPS2_9FLAO|nr:hypothetical protein [Myroides phaeus]MEC4116109.1 hypothetical protein [Myroides phaeus]SDH35195.1 hypothetical protein SAMN05421818_102176 [Myroides phaeus]